MASQVNLKEISYPYVNIYLKNGQDKTIVNNLDKVYLYIDENKEMGREHLYGNAYKAIRERANKLMSRWDAKVSKRQVSSLRRCWWTPKGNYVKIPYRMYYIFKAIFEIVDELKKEHPLPKDVECFLGEIRRECFYETQTSLYEEWYESHETKLNRALFDDMLAESSILSKEF